jgi:hypothetical protein
VIELSLKPIEPDVTSNITAAVCYKTLFGNMDFGMVLHLVGMCDRLLEEARLRNDDIFDMNLTTHPVFSTCLVLLSTRCALKSLFLDAKAYNLLMGSDRPRVHACSIKRKCQIIPDLMNYKHCPT